MLEFFFFFFFQAEDGIRDKLVTGVQTCALPISTLPEMNEINETIRGSGHGSGWRVGTLEIDQGSVSDPCFGLVGKDSWRQESFPTRDGLGHQEFPTLGSADGPGHQEFPTLGSADGPGYQGFPTLGSADGPGHQEFPTLGSADGPAITYPQ